MKTLLCILMLAVLGTAVAKADTVTVTFDDPNQTASQGQTIAFFGTITNDTNATVFLNSDSPNLAGLSLTIDDLFFSNVPASLAPFASSGDIELFDVTVSSPLADPFGTYDGTYNLVGGSDANAQDNLLNPAAAFSVTTVPEPASIYLLLSGGLAGFVPLSRKVRARFKA